MMSKQELGRMNKKTGEELQMFFHFKKRGGTSSIKKGKGSYNRKKMKDADRRSCSW